MKNWHTPGLIACVHVAAFLALPLQAGATTVTECLDEIGTLRLATQAATYLRDDLGAKLEEQLVLHLDKASAELNKADLKDALKQMDNYSSTLDRGSAAAKIDPADAAALAVGAADVVTCISAIAP